MTAANRRDEILFTINNYEGKTLDRNPKDRGNWTSGKIGVGELKGSKMGIAAFVYPNVDIANLTLDGAVAIYERDYWPKIDGDNLPDGIDGAAYDGCVNSGASRSLGWLGKGLGTPIRTPAGLSALARQAADKPGVVKAMCAARRSFLIGLHNATFEKGWLKRVATVEARGVSKALKAKGLTPAQTKQALLAESGNAAASSGTHSAAATVGSGAPTLHASQHVWALDWATFGEVALIVGGVGLLAFFVWHALAHKERAVAFKAAAGAEA